MLVETRIAILACVCCKCTTCKCIGGASKKKKQKAITSAETSTAPLKPGIPHDPSDEEETYHVRGARHIPKKVYKPILKPPRSRHDSRLGRFSSHERLVAVTHEGGLYAELKSVALETTKSGKPIELKEHHMDCTDANVDEMVTSCRKKVAMKRGFRQLFAAERTDRTGDEEDTNGVEMERKRPVRFFQKLFRPAGSHTSSPGESPRAFRRTSHADEDQYAEIKREMSVPVSPKSVKFQDEVPARRGQSAVPQTFAFSSRTTQQRTTFDHQHTSTATSTTTPLSWQSHQTTTEFRLSVPVSPKSVKFQDEVPARRGQSAVPQTFAFSSRTTQQRTTFDHQHTSTATSTTTPLSWQSHQTTTEFGDTQNALSVQQLQMQSTSRDVHRLDASQSMLDEATRELLQLSASPTAASSISYSSTARLTPAADQLQKSASTSSMNKVIRTVDGGVLKLANVFTWDAVRLSENPHQRPISPLERTFVDGDGNPHTTLYLYTDGTKGAPAVRTSVQGKLKMEKIVGADLVNTEHCVSSGWTIKDTVTHYKVKTKLGERTLVMEERKLPNGEEPANDFKMSVYEGDTLKSEQQADIKIPPNLVKTKLGERTLVMEERKLPNGEEPANDFKMSVYEGDTLKSEQQADIKIPPNLSKAEYLAYLSERLLRDMEKLEQDEKRRKTTTRIEVEVIEDVTKLLKTYVIGERAELQPQVEVELDQAAIDASDEFMSGQQTYEHASDDESSSPPIEKIDKEYIDSLESKVKKEITATDIRLQAEGQHFAGQSQLIRRVYAESEESSGSTAAWRKEPRCANLSAECELNRTEDSSCNDVLVAEPRVFSAQLSLIRERMVGPERRTATYDMHQLGKRFASETTIRRANKINLEDSTEERAETAAPVECYEMEQEGQRFTDDIRMQSTKRYESEDAEEASKRMQVTECELVRKEDCSWNNVVIALPRTEEVKVLIERSRMIQRQAKAAAYDLEQEGQRFEEETTIRRSNKINLEDSTEERAETAAPGECYAMKQEGQRFTDDVRMQSTKRYESEDAEEASKRTQVTECELIRKEDCSWNNVMIALPRTEEVSVLFKRSRMIQRQAKAAAYDLEQEGQRFEGETIIKRIKHFQSAQSTEEPLEEMGVLKIKDQVREPLPGNYEVQLLGQDFRGEGLIKRTRQFLSSESVEEETGGGVTQVGLNKNSSRGQFEATVVISNDLKRPPIRLKETMETRTVGLTASLARRKCDSLEQRAVLMDKNAWTETYSGRELAEKQTNVMIAIQKTEWDGEAKHETLKNMSAGNSERAQGKFHECTEEQAVIVCGLQCFATHTAAAEVVQGEKITQRIRYSTSATEEEHIHTKAFIASSEVATEEARTQRATTNCASAKYSCVETRSATTSIIVCLQNKAATSLMLSADQVRHDIRSSKGHQLTTIAMSEETVHKEFGIRQGSQFGKSEQADLLVQEKPARTVKFHTKSSREETSTSSMALSKGAKMESGTIKLISKGLQKHCATVAEFGDEIENFTVLLRNSGASHEHTAGQWAEPEDDNARGESMDEDRDENVMSRRIRVRVSEDTDMSTNEDLCAAAERCLMRRVTDQAEMYSENLAEVCYLIKVARNEGSANCLVVITIARKQSWRSVPIQSGTRIQMTASSSSAERVISKKDVSDQSREQIKRITFAETGQRSSEQTTIIHIIPIVLSENEMEVQTQRVSFTNDQTVHQASAFQFRNVPIYQAESSNTSLAHRGNFTSVFSDKTCFGTHVGSTELGVLNGVSDSRHSVLHDYEYRFEEERQGTSRIEQRGGVESSSMWNRDEEQQGETQVLANIPSENSSAGSTTSASFERVDRSQDHCSRSTAVSKVLNATRPDDGSSTDADISRSSTMSAACSSSLAHQMYQLRNQRLAMKRHSSRDNGVVEVPTRKAAAMGRTRNISESGSDSTLIEEHERANMSEHEASHSLTKWSAELSAARIAMMQAGVDLETVLLSTPASMFARSAMRSELNNTRQSLNAHRNIAESEFTEDNRSWKDRGFYRSFEYRHHWSSERDIRAVSIEESRPRSMRCSSAERLERLILAQDRLEDSTCMERMQPLDIYESDTANFIRRQKLVEEGKCRDRLRLAEERTEAKRWHDEQIGKIGRDMHRRQQRDLSTSDFRTPTLRTYSSVTSQTENAFKQFGYITTTDTVIHCDQEAKTISERPRTEKAFLDERMESIEKTNSATNVAIIPLVMKRDNAAQTSPIELSERNYVNELVCHAITVERVRPVELSSSFAQTDDIYEGVVSHQFEGIHPSHNIMQKSSTEQTNEQTEELSHTKAQFDTFIRTRAISLRNKNLTGELISARGSALEAIDHPQYIQRKEGFVEVGKLEATKQTSQEKVFAERRYGGSLRLDTCASEDNTVQHEMAIVATEVKSVAVEACRIEKSTTSPVYLYAAAVREESVVANAQLQKSAAFYCASRMWITSRKGDDQIFRVKESTELDEYSNLQMRREEFRGEIESVLKDCRFGGRIELRTSQAEETDVSISQNFMKQQASIEVSIVRKAVNREQPTVQRYHASEEAEVELLSRLECGKIRSAHVAVLQSAPNKESPVWLQTGESVESLMAINISMQRSLDEEVSSCTLREKRYGGVVHLTCVAVTEQYTGEILLSIQKSSAFAQTSLSVRTANKTAPQLLQTNASTETTSVLQTSITSRLEHFSASACRAQALFGGCIAAKFMAAEETIFNAEISYEKQQSDAEFILSRQEIRQESPKLLQTAASQSEQIEVTETEVRRRLTEVHVESAVERAAREITPVSLQTDYASETLIRTDEELRSFEHRHIAEAHAEQSVAVTESDTIVCTAPVHVELRHEEESREELKEEKSEKRCASSLSYFIFAMTAFRF
ncbi:Copine family protein 2 [Toxocara canis]|uniref:Copine family protein 2 n=1 Tax=Toxocara canis TaxID=6265 RepID=A0A0B2VEB4_TOXCA|nr:Copine family protein 2 [Toxocara canis]